MVKVRMPSIKSVARELRGYKSYLEKGGDADVRLQVMDDGGWCVHMGDASYDQDHRGFWGASGLTRSTNCVELARELIDQCADHAAQCE